MPGGTNGDEAIKHVGKRRVRIAGRFFPQGAGAVVNASNIGKAGWTVVRTSQGLFTITLDRKWLKLVPLGNPAIQSVAAAVRFGQWGLIDLTGALPTLQIRVLDAAAAVQDMAADANTSIGFEIEAVQDSVQG